MKRKATGEVISKVLKAHKKAAVCRPIIYWKVTPLDIALKGNLLDKEGKEIWSRSVVVITTARLYSAKPELRFCTGSRPAWRIEMVRISDSGPGWK